MSAPAHLPLPADDRDTVLGAAVIWSLATGMTALAMSAPGFNLLDVAATVFTLWAAIGTVNYVSRSGRLTGRRIVALAFVVLYAMLAAGALLVAGGVA